MRKIVGIGLALQVLAVGGLALAASAELRPSHIALDEAATLRLASDDNRAAAPPRVDGLAFTPSGQSREVSVINGAVSQHTFQLYQVTATRPGSYAIPVGGQTLRLEVGPAGQPAPSPSPTASTRATDARDRQSPLALLRVSLPRQPLYVGQAVPVTFRAYFRPGTEVTLTGPPSLTSSAFTLSQLSTEPRQSVETVGGVPYRVATWTGQLSAAMPGSQSTEATLPIIARYREAPARRPAADPFADMDSDDPASLMRSFMGHSPFGGDVDDMFAPVRERELTLRSTAQALQVRPLPSGAPADFRGAVGHFDVRATLTPSAGSAFEPMNLKIAVSGRGNFDRVNLAGLPSTADWKSYPPRVVPNAAGVVGTKLFEQAVVPQTSGRVELPAIAFSFFDPDQRRYVTRSTAALSVHVAPSAGAGGAAAAGSSPSPSSDTSAPAVTPNAPSPGATSPAAGPTVATLAPPYYQAWFWLLLALPVAALAALTLALGERRPSARAQRRARQEALAQQRAAMRRAAEAQDALRFFTAAQAALQQRLGERWGVPPADVTSAEVERRMGAAAGPIAATLATAEQSRYAGRLPPPGTLLEDDARIGRQLDQLDQQEERP